MTHPLFLLGFCLLLVHEMDAIRCKEWRLFPVTSRMRDETGYRVFTAVHVPLYVFVLWGLFGGEGVNPAWVFIVDAFLVVHVFLHLIFIGHPEYRFRSTFSWALIVGAGACGVLDLLSFI